MRPAEDRVWLTPDGRKVACVEKLKVLEQNLEEFAAMARDILEDAALMGCDTEQVREILLRRLAEIRVEYGS